MVCSFIQNQSAQKGSMMMQAFLESICNKAVASYMNGRQLLCYCFLPVIKLAISSNVMAELTS